MRRTSTYHLLPLRHMHEGLLAASLRYNAFKLSRYRVVNPGIAALGTEERGHLPDNHDAECQSHSKGRGAWLPFAAAQRTTPDILAHDCFLTVLKYGSTRSRSNPYSVMTWHMRAAGSVGTTTGTGAVSFPPPAFGQIWKVSGTVHF
jgi:hypothetical protein